MRRDGAKMMLRDCCATLLALVVLLSAVLAEEPLPSPAHFYPYGPGIGDQTVPTNDDESSGKIFVSTMFPYFDERHDSLYVSSCYSMHILIDWKNLFNLTMPRHSNRQRSMSGQCSAHTSVYLPVCTCRQLLNAVRTCVSACVRACI